LEIKLVNKQLPQGESRPRLRALANIGRNSLRVVLRQPPNNNHNNQNGQNPAKEVDDEQTLIALHKACGNKSDVQVIKYLVVKHPLGAAAKIDGNLPLHTACMKRAKSDVIEALLDAHPEGTGERNSKFKLPIHVALECGASLEVIKLLVSKDPDSLQVADYDILTTTFQKVWIVHKAKFGLDARAGLPLHTACKNLANLHIIHYLITGALMYSRIFGLYHPSYPT